MWSSIWEKLQVNNSEVNVLSTIPESLSRNEESRIQSPDVQ